MQTQAVLTLLLDAYLKKPLFRSSRPEVFCKKDVLRNFVKFPGKHLCKSLWKISKNAFCYRTPPVAASVYQWRHSIA